MALPELDTSTGATGTDPQLLNREEANSNAPNQQVVTVYSTKTREPLQVPPEEAQRLLLSGEAGLPKSDTLNLVGPDGRLYAGNADEVDLHGAIGHGFRLESDVERSAREAADAEAKQPWNQGLGGAIRAGTMGALDAMSLGTLEAGAEGKENAEQKATRQKLQSEHKVAGLVGEGVGTLATLPLMGGGLGLAGKAAEGAVIGERTGVAAKLLGGAVDMGAQGGLLAAPKAGVELLENEPEKAGESLLLGIGVGALLGGVSRGSGLASDAAASSADKYIQKLGGAEEAAKEAGRWANYGAGKAAEAGVVGAGATIGHAVGFPGAGAYIAKTELGNGARELAQNISNRYIAPGIASAVRGLATSAAEGGYGERLAQFGVDELGHRLSTIPKLLNRLTSESVPSTKQDDPIKSFLGSHSNGLSKDQQLQRLEDEVDSLVANPQLLVDKTHSVTQHLGEGSTLAYSSNAARAIQYVSTLIPRQPAPNGLFSGKQQFQPTDQQRLKLEQGLSIVNDPFNAFTAIQRNKLTSNHVEALQAVWPKTYSEMQQAVLQAASQSNAPKLSQAKLSQLQLFMGGPLNAAQQPSVSQAMQQVFVPAPATPTPAVKGTKALGKLPSPETGTQRLAHVGNK